MDKTISVIVPCYKYANYLPECIQSLRTQTYPIHEIIVVNDGSPDNTEEVCKELGVTCLTKPNGGLSSARNWGIERCTGEYIMCLDADDKLVPGALQAHMELIEDDMTIAQCALMEFGERHITYAPTGTTNLRRVMQSNTIFCNAVFSKKLWEMVGGYDESETMKMGYEDWEFWIRCLEVGAYVRRSDFIALRYRAHQNNMTKETAHPNRQKLYEYIYNKHKALYDREILTVSGMLQTHD